MTPEKREPGVMTEQQTAEALADADLAATDLEYIAAALRELTEYIADGGPDSTTRIELGAEVLPRLTALRAFFTEQVSE